MARIVLFPAAKSISSFIFLIKMFVMFSSFDCCTKFMVFMFLIKKTSTLFTFSPQKSKYWVTSLGRYLSEYVLKTVLFWSTCFINSPCKWLAALLQEMNEGLVLISHTERFCLYILFFMCVHLIVRVLRTQGYMIRQWQNAKKVQLLFFLLFLRAELETELYVVNLSVWSEEGQVFRGRTRIFRLFNNASSV